MLPRTARLRSSSDIKRVYNRGMSAAGKHIVVYLLPDKEETRRLGLSVSRRVGVAVVRNRVRRRISAAFAGLADSAPAGDIVVVARPRAAKATYQILERELDELLEKAAGKGRERGKT